MKTTGCVLDWRGGTRDWSRYHHTLIEHNTIPVRGVNGEARRFDGATSYIDCGNHSSLNITDAITIEAWVKTSDITQDKYILGKDNGIAGHRAYSIKIESSKVRFLLWDSSGTLKHLYTNVGVISNNVWFCLVCVRHSDDSMKLYINSVLQDDTDTISDIADVSSSLNIGRIPASYFNGTISSVRIYNRALTPLEIWNNYVTMKPYIPLSESPVAIV